MAKKEREFTSEGGTKKRDDDGLVKKPIATIFGMFKVAHAFIGSPTLEGKSDILDFGFAEMHVDKEFFCKTWNFFYSRLHFIARSASAQLAHLQDLIEGPTDAPLWHSLADSCAGSWMPVALGQGA